MKIRYRIALVGGIPVAVAAAIAVATWVLLSEAERVRNGAVLAGAAYRDLLAVTTARDEYIAPSAAAREQSAARLNDAAERASRTLANLAEASRVDAHKTETNKTQDALGRYREQIGRLVAVTKRNDRLIAEMAERAASSIELADRARERQHASNADILTSLAEGDRRLRATRDVVDHAHEMRAALLMAALSAGSGSAQTDAQAVNFAQARLLATGNDLARRLQDSGQSGAANELAAFMRLSKTESAGDQKLPANSFAGWIDRLIKINATEQRALHDEVAQLLAYSVQAAETEQATQNIAIATLKLSRRAADALANRDAEATKSILDESRALTATMKALPISPLIQAEMIDANERWHDGLATTSEGLRAQNEIIASMNNVASVMTNGAGALNDMFIAYADRIGRFVQTMLAMGAAFGLLLGSGTALVVARSMTQPLRRLKDSMMRLAADPRAGTIEGVERRDELGAMARATDVFVTEIGRREQALRLAKEQADTTLHELRETQASLVQAEKLASLGQLVAGVAHEINTPLGVALTTWTSLEGDIRRLERSVETGRLLRSELTHTLKRLNEGSRLGLANMTRAVDLVHSFKQVAADQASGERRRFEMKNWLHELLTSLGPALRKEGHSITTACPPDLILDTYPGALAQILTNLIINAVAHAYPDGRSGCMSITVLQPAAQTLRIVFADDGKGIASDHLGKVFDPFFTTGRDRGNTGLGLHIVHNLVTVRLHGRIELKSQVGQGTQFVIDLPHVLADTAAEPSRVSA